MNLTKRQFEVYNWIANFIDSNGYSPSFEEIGNGIGCTSSSTIFKHVDNLQNRGVLEYHRFRARSITLTRKPVKNRTFLACLKALRLISQFPRKNYIPAGVDCGNADDVYEDGYQAAAQACARYADAAIAEAEKAGFLC